MKFEEAFSRLLAHEGGFTDNPKDRGNWTGGRQGIGELKGTKFGISAMSYPDEDIAGLSIERAKEIYFADFWTPAGCDDVPEPMRFDLFDTAVNSGVNRAVKLLQKAAGAEADGVLGPKTLLVVRGMEPNRLAARFNGWRLDFMNDNPDSWATFGRGWAQRIAENLKAL
jgi:lysozyme family protein